MSPVRDRLYPENARLLAQLDDAPLPGDPRFDLARSRREVSRSAPAWLGTGRCVVRDAELAGVPCRVYCPPRPQGMVVHAHGGGFVEGDLETHDAVCRELSVCSGWAVAAVDYRLAPEHPFPAAYEDVEAVVDEVRSGGPRPPALEGVPREPVALVGDSAGAVIVAGITLRERRARAGAPTRFALQVLVYPDCGQVDGLVAVPDIERGFGLTPEARDWYHTAFVPDGGDVEELAPLRSGSYADLPPAVVITAELDPLRESAEEYAARLAGAGVPVVCTRYLGAVHGFWRRPGHLQSATAAVDQVAAALRRLADGRGEDEDTPAG
ncbi:MAG TPA: alpha/beta hydrolase [Segeticoccus sp.]|nr:alpha/beta hydrolase [Segeticoccus sp.]